MHARVSTFGVAVFCVAVFALLAIAPPAWADFRLERRLALAPGGLFVLSTDLGSVTLAGDSPSGVVVTVTAERDDVDRRMDFQFQEQAGTVRVTATRRSSITSWLDSWRSGMNVRFTVHVPRRTAVSIDTAGGSIQLSSVDGHTQLRTSGGALTVDDVMGDLMARTSGGAIRVARVAGAVDVRTSGGPIDVATVRGSVSAETSGGPIQVRDAGGRVEARTSGGPITVTFAPGNARGGVLATSGGGVSATVDPAMALSIDASTSGGAVSSDLAIANRGPVSRNALRGDLNGGGAVLQVRSSGGPIRVSAGR